jgi:predicted nucleic acid-binding protein
MSERVLVDTSAWIEALRPSGDERIRGAVRLAIEDGSAVLCDMVLLELWNGARGDRERQYLEALERDLDVIPIDPSVWARSRDLARRCRNAGTTVPATDVLIAACAVHHGVALLHRDRHFDQIRQVESPGSPGIRDR